MKILSPVHVLASSLLGQNHGPSIHSSLSVWTPSPSRNPPIVNPTQAPYQNPKLPTWERVEDLLSRMPLREKMAQLMQGEISYWVNFTSGEFNISAMKDHMLYHSGMLRVSHPQTTADIAYRSGSMLQDWIMNETSLSLPAFIQCEGLHGLGVPGATIFTSPIGFGASWNPELVERTALIIGQEARALGISQIFSPSADLARDPRHGRVEESMSEDPFLAGELVASFVRALRSVKVASIVKHLVAFGNSEQGLNLGPVRGGERELRTTYLPPFRKAVEAGAVSIMTSYNSYDGIPAMVNKHILTGILRGEWDFQYWTTTDYAGPDRLCTHFCMCETQPLDSATIATKMLEAGVDTEGGGSFHYELIPELVSSGSVSARAVDEATRRVLRTKFDMGLFEDPFPAAAPEAWPDLIHTPRSLGVARELDLESIILLENDGVLPLSPSLRRLAVIGPFADVSNYGGYVAYRPRGVPPLAGIQRTAPPSMTVEYAKGCDAWSNDKSAIPEAVNLASVSDVAIVVVGTWSRDLKGQGANKNATTGEAYDQNDLCLVGAQGELIRKVIDTGVPTVVVLSSGKPITEPWITDRSSALLQQFYPSEEGGIALASVLFGSYNPSGKLPITFPRTVGSLPVNYDYLASGQNDDLPGHKYQNGSLEFGRSYVLDTAKPWYAFGHGLSYTKFHYSEIRLSQTRVRATDVISVYVDVSNIGDRDGAEVVQVYIKDPIASVVQPNKRLQGFKKVWIAAGARKTVKINIEVRNLGVWNMDMKYDVEAGEFVVLVGSSSDDIRSVASFSAS